MTSQRRGIVSILALILLALFATLAVSFAGATNSTLLKAGNQQDSQTALMQAETGLEFYLFLLKKASLPGKSKGQAMLDDLNAWLRNSTDLSGNLGGQAISYDGATITVPWIAPQADGGRFSAQITRLEETVIRVRITGQDAQAARSVSMDFDLAPGRSIVLDYGIASKSAIVLTGNDRITGANNATEANILSATYSTATAVSMTGNARIQGDVFVSNPSGQVSLTGNVSIGGATGAAVADHVHVGVGDPEFPEVDPTVFEPFATNIVDKTTSTSGNKTFTNIRIKAGTNPTFSGNIIVKGVIFVEKPNKVTFSGNLNFTGVLVTQDAGDGVYTTNTIKFAGNTSTAGVETLPDTPEFHALRLMPGSFLLAPGFGVEFTGNFGTANGAIAADCFKLTGNAGGTVYGPVINYSDSEFRMTGNASLVINRSKYSGTPPGLSSPSKLAPDSSSYTEY